MTTTRNTLPIFETFVSDEIAEGFNPDLRTSIGADKGYSIVTETLSRAVIELQTNGKLYELKLGLNKHLIVTPLLVMTCNIDDPDTGEILACKGQYVTAMQNYKNDEGFIEVKTLDRKRFTAQLSEVSDHRIFDQSPETSIPAEVVEGLELDAICYHIGPAEFIRFIIELNKCGSYNEVSAVFHTFGIK